MSVSRRAFVRGVTDTLAKLGYDVASNADGATDATPSRHTLVAATDPGERDRRWSNIENTFAMNRQFAQTSPASEPGATNPSINNNVGPGDYANRTQSSGGVT